MLRQAAASAAIANGRWPSAGSSAGASPFAQVSPTGWAGDGPASARLLAGGSGNGGGGGSARGPINLGPGRPASGGAPAFAGNSSANTGALTPMARSRPESSTPLPTGRTSRVTFTEPHAPGLKLPNQIENFENEADVEMERLASGGGTGRSDGSR